VPVCGFELQPDHVRAAQRIRVVERRAQPHRVSQLEQRVHLVSVVRGRHTLSSIINTTLMHSLHHTLTLLRLSITNTVSHLTYAHRRSHERHTRTPLHD
jgi:hypothetical protein